MPAIFHSAHFPIAGERSGKSRLSVTYIQLFYKIFYV